MPVIFDMDGVLVDGEPLHYEAVRAMLAEEGEELTPQLYQRYLGTALDATWDDLHARFQLAQPRQVYLQRYDREVRRQYREEAELLPGARALLERLAEAAVPLALASSSNRAWVDTALAALQITPFFEAIVAGDEVRHGKPHPEIYERAAEAIGARAGACTAVEDAPAGIESAKAAGMQVVAVRTPMTEGLPLDADRVIDTLDQFELDWLSEFEKQEQNETPPESRRVGG